MLDFAPKWGGVNKLKGGEGKEEYPNDCDRG